MSSDGLSRVIQGIVTGIGFIGAGSILKLSEERDIQGLTTSAGIWMTAAVGVAVGSGSLGVALLSTLMALIILALVPLESRIDKEGGREGRRPRTGKRTSARVDNRRVAIQQRHAADAQ